MTFRLASSGGSRERLTQSSALEPMRDEVRDEHSAALQEDLSWPPSDAAKRHRVSIAGGPRRRGYRETAFRAVAHSLVMGAVLLAVVHAAGTSTDAAVGASAATPAPSPTRGDATGVSTGAAGTGALLVDLAITEKRLVVPPVRLPMFEAGAYFTYRGATQAAASFSASGVQTAIAGAQPPYTLLVAPYFGAKARVQATERLLARAEVPYFVRPWTAGAVALALPPALRSRAGALERCLIADEQVLWWLVGGAGKTANGPALWTASRAAAQAAATDVASSASGVLGVELRQFDAAVGRAWTQRGAGAAGQAAQTQALAVLARLR